MKKYNKIIFIAISALSFFLILVSTYYLEKFLSNRLTPSNIIATLALALSVTIPLWDRFFPKKPIRSYHVSPNLYEKSHYWDDEIKFLVNIQNKGEVSVSIRFNWVEMTDGTRFTRTDVRNYKGEKMDNSSIVLEPQTERDILVSFKTKDSKWIKISNDLVEAVNKKDLRLAEGVRNLQARITWSDLTGVSLKKDIPLGSWLYQRVTEDINKSKPNTRTVSFDPMG